MLENRFDIIIEAHVEKVWNILTALNKYAEWNPLLYKANGIISAGESIIVHAKTATKDMRLKCNVEKVETFRELTWSFYIIHPVLLQGVHTFQLEPDEDRVKFIDRERFSGVLLPTQVKDLKTNGLLAMIAMGEALKTRAESE